MKKFEIPESAKPCPFCGAKGQPVYYFGDCAKIECDCGLTLYLRQVKQEYVPVKDDLYRLVGETNSDFLRRIGQTWNRRWQA